MKTENRFRAIRERLGLSQEKMARLLGVSYVSVNRWESPNASSPIGTTGDLYDALETALAAGHSPEQIRAAAAGDRGQFLRMLFTMAYQPTAPVTSAGKTRSL
jgi:transcriptional regulator with XRE-family HTH domain